MKILKYIFIILIIGINFSCSSYTRKDVENRYTKLTTEFDKLLEDEIVPKKRAKLEKEFGKYIQGVEKYKEENGEKKSKKVDEYLKNANLKLQYLKDLED